MASLKCQLESLAATMQSYKQKHKHNYLFYSPHMRHEHFANWYTLLSSLLARHPLEYIHNCRISRKRKWTSGWQQVSQMCTKWKLALTFLQALCMDGRRWQRGGWVVEGRGWCCWRTGACTWSAKTLQRSVGETFAGPVVPWKAKVCRQSES